MNSCRLLPINETNYREHLLRSVVLINTRGGCALFIFEGNISRSPEYRDYIGKTVKLTRQRNLYQSYPRRFGKEHFITNGTISDSHTLLVAVLPVGTHLKIQKVYWIRGAGYVNHCAIGEVIVNGVNYEFEQVLRGIERDNFQPPWKLIEAESSE